MSRLSLDDALDGYKRRKFVVIPLNGKRPFFKNWTTIKTTSSDRSTFNRRNIGVLTGRPSKITVLDIDLRDGGLTHWNRIKKLYPEIVAPMVATPGRGLHIYFKYNPKLSSTTKLRVNGVSVGWDVLNDGRQVVVPPSTHYRWIKSFDEAPLTRMPIWLEQYIQLFSRG